MGHIFCKTDLHSLTLVRVDRSDFFELRKEKKNKKGGGERGREGRNEVMFWQLVLNNSKI